MSYTKGPWEILPQDKYGISGYVIAAKKGRYIAETITYGDKSIKDNWDIANARLIAAAPELLEACKKLLEAINCNLDHDGLTPGSVRQQYIADEMSFMEYAINKAEGKL